MKLEPKKSKSVNHQGQDRENASGDQIEWSEHTGQSSILPDSFSEGLPSGNGGSTKKVADVNKGRNAVFTSGAAGPGQGRKAVDDHLVGRDASVTGHDSGRTNTSYHSGSKGASWTQDGTSYNNC